MNYETIIHAFIDDIVTDKETVMIRQIPCEKENGVSFLICSTSEDIARLIGRQGIIASSLREVLNIAGKLNNQEHVFLKFESFGENKE